MAGQRAVAYKTAATLTGIYAASPDRQDGPGPDVGWNLRLTTRVRFGAWQEVVSASPAQPRAWPYSHVVREYANGTALLQLGRVSEAVVAFHALESMLKSVPSAQARYAKVARLSLLAALQARGVAADDGTLGTRSANLSAAIVSLSAAASEQASWLYDEPPKWHMPMRQCLGTVQLQARQPSAAYETFSADLRAFPNNAFSLYGLLQSMLAQPGVYPKARVDQVEKDMHTAWKDADVPLTSACLAFEP